MKIHKSATDARTPTFSFVVLADTHVNEVEQGGSSPFIANSRANARARQVFDEIAAMQPAPAFVVHLGDIVHPVPSLPGFRPAVGHFRDMTAALPFPLHVVPGNHDVGDKAIDWMPADVVCDAYLAEYRELFGPDWFAFDHLDRRFVFMNSLLLNSGLADEAVQQAWLTGQIDTAGDRRVFLFMHYPPFIHSPTERGNYDNIDEPGRSWLLSQLGRPSVEAVFAGHVHNFWIDRIDKAWLYMLPSTAFVRHDFTEFYQVAPATEFGRGDAERFGYFVVDVFDDGHVAYSVRTLGASRLPDQPVRVPAQRFSRTWLGRLCRRRYRASPPVDRKHADHRHWRRSEFGRSGPATTTRCRRCSRWGSAWPRCPNWTGARPSRALAWRCWPSRGALRRLEVGGAARSGRATRCHRGQRVRVEPDHRGLRARQGRGAGLASAVAARCTLCRIRGGADDTRFDGKHFSHFVKAGFTVDELPAYRDQIAQAVAQGTIDGITIRAEPDADLVTAAEVLGRFCDDTGARLLVSVKLAGNNVAGERTDDGQTVSLAARALLLSRLDDRIQWLFDTFMDVDRGYFPRHAFIDRRFNPRAAAQAWSMIAAQLSGATVSRATRSSLALAGHDLVVMVDGKALVLLTGTGQELAERAAGIGRPVDWSADIVQAPNDTLTGRWPQLPAGANGVQAWLAVLTG
ncbi:MAG: metallophosphoesterase [Burkholderiaceae bacterium]